jgi:hypothetical protein
MPDTRPTRRSATSNHDQAQTRLITADKAVLSARLSHQVTENILRSLPHADPRFSAACLDQARALSAIARTLAERDTAEEQWTKARQKMESAQLTDDCPF